MSDEDERDVLLVVLGMIGGGCIGNAVIAGVHGMWGNVYLFSLAGAAIYFWAFNMPRPQ